MARRVLAVALVLGALAVQPTTPAVADGLPDPSLAGSGLFVGSLPGVPDNVESYLTQVIRDRSGRWLVVGQPLDASNAAIIARYTTDGRPDPTFGSGGDLVRPRTEYAPHALGVELDGTVVGLAQSEITVLGTTIEHGRYVTLPGFTTSPLTVLPDGRLLVPFEEAHAQPDGGTTTFAAAAIFDGPTSNAAPQILNAPANARIASAVEAATDASGRIYLLGCAPGAPVSCAVSAYTPDGSLDVTYGSGGTATVADAAGPGSCRFGVAPDGFVATACSTSLTDIRVDLLDSTGHPDTTFTPRDLATSVPNIGGWFDVKVDGSGRVLVGFSTPVTISQGRPLILALMPDGSNDPTFGVGGVAELASFGSTFAEIGLDDQGGVFAWGRYSDHHSFWIASVTEDAGTALQPPLESPSRFVPTKPERILDTRIGLGAPMAHPPAGSVIRLAVAGHGPVPGTDATAVALNVTATDAAAPGFVTVWPTGLARPIASNLNLTAAGETNANSVIVPIGADGSVSIFTQSGADLVADVAGYFVAADHATAGRFVPAPKPARLLDTRVPSRKLGAGQQVDLHVVGVDPVPASGVGAVVLNLTGTEATADGYVTAWPSGVSRPTASSLNLKAGATRANLVVVPIGIDGNVFLFTQSGAHLVADVEGWFTDDTAPDTDAGLFVAVPPRRMLDTRVVPGRIGPDSAVSRAVAGTAVVPPFATAVAANVTATNSIAAGFVTVAPDGVTRPNASTLNIPGRDSTVPNSAIVGLGADGGVTVYTQSGADLIVDVSGWFS